MGMDKQLYIPIQKGIPKQSSTYTLGFIRMSKHPNTQINEHVCTRAHTGGIICHPQTAALRAFLHNRAHAHICFHELA